MSTEERSRTSHTGRRSNSLVSGFIKRTRSTDLLTDRKSSGTYARRGDDPQSPGSPLDRKEPPRLPSFAPQPELQTFGGEEYAPKMAAAVHQAATTSSPIIDHVRAESMTNRGRYSYAVSTTSSVNSPRRVRRRKDPTPYNVLVIGARNSGKTSFLNFLKTSIAPHPGQQNARNPELDAPPPSAKSNPGTFVAHYQELELDNERIGLRIWDSQGLDKSVVEFQLREMTQFVESKFEDTFIEEMKVVRFPGYMDTHIHCVFFLFDPAQLDMNLNAARNQSDESIGTLGAMRKPTRIVGALDEDFELQILRNLQGKTTVIPVISKADTVTTTHMVYLKKMVAESFKKAGLDPLEALHFEGEDSDDDVIDEVDEEEGEEEKANTADQAKQPVLAANGPTDGATEQPSHEGDDGMLTSTEASKNESTASPTTAPANSKPVAHKRETSKPSVSTVMFDNAYLPMSIISPDEHSLGVANAPLGRKFAWGFADPYNPEHCDFVKLKETCFSEWRVDIKEASRDVFYERWRRGRLDRAAINGVKKTTAPAATSRKASGGIPIELSARPKRYTGA